MTKAEKMLVEILADLNMIPDTRIPGSGVLKKGGPLEFRSTYDICSKIDDYFNENPTRYGQMRKYKAELSQKAGKVTSYR